MPLRVRGTSMSAAADRLLRRQTLQNPNAASFAIAQAVMQPVRALLPEFDLIGINTIPSPVYGTRRAVTGIPGREFGKTGLEDGPRRDHRALARGQRRDAAPGWTRGEIRVRFGGRKLRYSSRDAHLAVHLAPIK